MWAYYPTLRDALVSGITLDTFNRHADKVAMANPAQLINDIHASFLAVGDRFTVTPIFHVFRMYAAHQGNTSVRALFGAPSISQATTNHLPALSGSCSMRQKHTVLTVVNPDIKNAQETEINIRAGRVSNARATVLTSSDIHAHNTFDNPRALEPAMPNISAATPWVYQFAPASVTCLEFDLV